MEASMKVKKLWRGAFNYRQSARVMYAFAYTENQAKILFCRRLAERDGVAVTTVMGLFDGSKSNYEITIEEEARND
jgi:cobyrinic acid a,c-diamide synthase